MGKMEFYNSKKACAKRAFYRCITLKM